MRITAISTTLYEYELERPLGDVNLPSGFRHGTDLAVRIRTDEPGLEGVSIGLAAAAAAIPQLGGLLEGEDPRSVRALWERMVAVAFKMGNAGPVKAAIAALDTALWDLRAKANGVPLWKELGAAEGRCDVYASGLDTPLSDDELVAFYQRMAAAGVRAGKLKVGRDPEADERRLELVAAALARSGARPLLMVDANEFWSPKQAVQRVRALERRFSLAWVEEPVRRWDHAGLRAVSRGIAAPVATGENLNVVQEFVPLLTNDAVDVVQIGVLVSGITGALQVAELAAAFERPVTMSNCPGRHMAHLAAALPHHTMMEVVDAGRDAVLESQPPIVDGRLVLGDAPGSGIAFDAERLERHRVDAPTAPGMAALYRRAPDAGGVG